VASLPEKDAGEDHGDVGLTISSNGQEYPLQSVFTAQRTEFKRVESLGVRVSDLRSSVMRMDIARKKERKKEVNVTENVTEPINHLCLWFNH